MKELDIVELTEAFEGLAIGTEGVIVGEHDGRNFEVEFYDSNDETIDVFTTPRNVLKVIFPFVEK